MKIEETGTSFLDEPQNGLVKHEPTETQVVSLDNIAARIGALALSVLLFW